MGSLFKRVRADEKKAEKYTIKYRQGDGTWKMETAYADKEASRALLAEREKMVARGEVGLVDKYASFRQMPLVEHVTAFQASIEAGGATKKYVNKVVYRVKCALTVMEARTFKDLTRVAAERFILHLQDKKAATATINHYVDALREFSKWGAQRERWPVDSLAALRRIKGKHDVRRKRRALENDELSRLVAAARTRALAGYVASHPKADAAKRAQMERQGANRAIAYQLGALAGLRFNEIKTLQWGDLNFDRAPAQLTVRAKNAKSKREDTVPISDALARELLDWRYAKAAELGRNPLPNERVVFVGSRFRDSFRSDCKAAGIELKDAMDRWADVHSLRHTFATMLARANVHPKVAQTLLRHTDVRLTLQIYTHADAAAQSKALAALPDISGKAAENVTTDVTTNVTTAASAAGKRGQ